mmetsp:Transcript_43869/g.125492  ORF Transcript_43869/g.125492 Transcript_43869/m.125492 type:complete len:203 (-) Transcript_43869:1000-1608(-)
MLPPEEGAQARAPPVPGGAETLLSVGDGSTLLGSGEVSMQRSCKMGDCGGTGNADVAMPKPKELTGPLANLLCSLGVETSGPCAELAAGSSAAEPGADAGAGCVVRRSSRAEAPRAEPISLATTCTIASRLIMGLGPLLAMATVVGKTCESGGAESSGVGTHAATWPLKAGTAAEPAEPVTLLSSSLGTTAAVPASGAPVVR